MFISKIFLWFLLHYLNIFSSLVFYFTNIVKSKEFPYVRSILTQFIQLPPRSALGNVSNIWRSEDVASIPNTGKEDCALARSYRLIRLIYFLQKALQRILDNYLLRHFNTVPFHKNQHAYKTGRSTYELI